MVTQTEKEEFVSALKSLYPEASSFLRYQTDWQLLFATMLSAQATDKSVNQVTERLFRDFPSLEDYTEINREKIFALVRPVGLGKSKTDHLLSAAGILLSQYGGKVPKDRNAICSLPGCGVKTSGVFLGEFYDEKVLPVDTHVYRVVTRIGIVKEKITPEECEKRLEKCFREEADILLHRRIILFGRNICLSRKPKCMDCPFSAFCRYYKKSVKQKA